MVKKTSYRILLILILGMGLIVSASPRNDTLRYADGAYAVGVLEEGLKDGIWRSYYSDGALHSEGRFDHGLRVGSWIWYHENGRKKAVEEYVGGLYKEGEYWDDRGHKSDISVALTSPEYPGGMEAFTQLISENLVYPENVLEEGVEGSVVLQFQVSALGRVINPVVASSVHPELDKEALRVIQLSERWIPAEFHGKKTTTQYTFPITFALK